MRRLLTFPAPLVLLLLLLLPNSAQARTVTDSMGRSVEIPDTVTRVICSGPGSLRLLTYLEAQDMIVAVDDMEAKRPSFDARPYALANPQFKKYPVFGEFRGFDNPELILALEHQPQVILKTYATMGHDPVELQDKTGIPVVVLEYGNLGSHRQELYASLRIMGQVVGRSTRAEEVVAFFEESISDLEKRTAHIHASDKKTCFVGGIAYKGPHGYLSTEPGYPPFMFVSAANLAFDASQMDKASRQVTVAKEKLLEWDPEVLFLDLSTLQLGGKASGLWELRNDPAMQALTAVQQGRVYGVLPYNWYSKNYGSILADAYFIGKTLYPERFADVDPTAKADAIYEFLVGKGVFAQMNALFDNLAFTAVPLD